MYHLQIERTEMYHFRRYFTGILDVPSTAYVFSGNMIIVISPTNAIADCSPPACTAGQTSESSIYTSPRVRAAFLSAPRRVRRLLSGSFPYSLDGKAAGRCPAMKDFIGLDDMWGQIHTICRILLPSEPFFQGQDRIDKRHTAYIVKKTPEDAPAGDGEQQSHPPSRALPERI